MTYDRTEALAVLARTPKVLDAWLRELPDSLVRANEGPGTWSAFDVLGHLIHGERTDWIPRARHLLEHGEARAFEPFDRFAQLDDNRGRRVQDLLEDFTGERAASLTALAELPLDGETLARSGLHPELGVVTLGELLSTWVVHDQVHIAQIGRVFARRLGDDVGAWRAYLPILDR